jgi:hypothetical protein
MIDSLQNVNPEFIFLLKCQSGVMLFYFAVPYQRMVDSCATGNGTGYVDDVVSPIRLVRTFGSAPILLFK